MRLLRLQRLTFGLIALLAVGWAQTSGLHRGFMCDCGGVEHITHEDHCHGPHSSACHEDEDDSVPHPHDEDDGDTHQHAAVVDSIIAKQQNEIVPQLTAPLSTFSTLDLWESSQRTFLGTGFVTEKPPQRSWLAQDWPRRLAQTIALRI